MASGSGRTSTTALMSARLCSTRWRRSVATEARPATRSRYSFTSMGLSLGIVLGIVVLTVLLLPRAHYNAVKQIDPTEPIVAAQRVAPYHVYAPAGLPSSWQPTSARVEGPDEHHVVHLHVGYYTPRGAYAALEESNDGRVPFLELQTAHGKLTGQRTIGDRVWETRYSANQKDNSLDFTTADGATVIVTGSATYEELSELAASLRGAAPSLARCRCGKPRTRPIEPGLADRGQLLAAPPERQRFLEWHATRLQP